MNAFVRVGLAAGALLGAAGPAAAENVTARARIEANSVFVGEPVRFQIQVSGSETPEQPEIPELDGLKMVFARGAANSRHSVTIINGRRTENKQLGYIFDYELRATREGRLVIPAIPVKAGGDTVMTQPLVLNAQKPSETENYKLRVSFSKERAYVGEQITMEAVFYFRGEVDSMQLAIPLFDDAAFEVFDVEAGPPASSTEMLDGQQFRTGRARKVIVPVQAGEFAIEPATLSFRGQEGFEIVRDLFGNPMRRAKFRNFVIPSNGSQLTVLPLPAEGRPAGFAGHVGEYTLNVQATPTEVNVGDPITLNIAVTGPPLLDPVELPPLHEQESLTRDFRVPSDIEDGSVNGNFKVFTQTVRALHDDVKQIPAIELAYFDTAKGAYEVARSRAIPIVVKPTRIVTAGDIEGVGPVGAEQTEIQSWVQGIAHNYGGAEALTPQVLGFGGLASPGRLALVVGPPLLYAVLFGAVAAARRRHANPERTRARRAAAVFARDVPRAGGPEEVLSVFCRYLGDKLGRASEALTFLDVEGPLRMSGADDETLARVRKLFTAGEASRFAGGGGAAEAGEAREEAAQLVKEFERSLR